MSHAANRAWERYGFFVSTSDLLKAIHAGNAKEQFHHTLHEGRRMFDVPLTFENGETRIIRCLTSSTVKSITTILPPETTTERIARERVELQDQRGKQTRKIHKLLRQGPQADAEVVASVEELDADARKKLDQERANARAATSLGNMTVLEKLWHRNAQKRLDAYKVL
jgi:hypothetical protein